MDAVRINVSDGLELTLTKDSIIYVVDRDAMGKFNAGTDQIYQEDDAKRFCQRRHQRNRLGYRKQRRRPLCLRRHRPLTKELYNSNQAAGSRDHFSGNKFITPMVVNGKVYVGTPNSVAVFGLLP